MESIQADASARARLREALLDLCLERGYRNLNLIDLLERAGFSKAEFHRHYADLEECFCAIYREARDHFLASVERAIASQPSWRDRIRVTAYAFLDFFREDERVTHLSVVEVRTAGEPAQLLFAEAFERLMDLIDEGRGERGEPDRVSRATAEGLAGGIFAQMYLAVEQRRLEFGEEEIPKLMYAAVLPYLGPEAAAEELQMPSPTDTQPQ